MIDLHSHVLPGLDDGAVDLDASVEMARSMAADGVTVVCGTPHVRDDFPTSVEAMEDALARVRDAVAEAGIAIEVRGGGEIALDRLPALDARMRARFGLGGQPDAPVARDALHGLAARSRAHVRPAAPRAHRSRASRIPSGTWTFSISRRCSRTAVRAGAFVQLTAASVDGRLGKSAARCSRELLELGLAHCIASDAHGPGVREAGLSAAAKAVGGGEMATLAHPRRARRAAREPPVAAAAAAAAAWARVALAGVGNPGDRLKPATERAVGSWPARTSCVASVFLAS